MLPDRTYTVTVGADCVTLRKKGESTLRVGQILGREVHDGHELVYVDRLLVPPGDITLNGDWSASGCVSTILSRRVDQTN